MLDPNRLLAAIKAFLQVSNDEELATTFQAYPELLDENIDPILMAVIVDNREQGKTELVRILEKCYQRLQTVRPKFKEFIFYQATIQQAQIAEQCYLNGDSDISALDEAVQIWERLLHYPDFATAKVEYRFVIINNSATTYLRRYNAKGNLSDLTVALNAWEQAIALTLPDSTELPTLLSNLGTGLTNRYALLGNLTDLQQSIEAFQRAIALTRPDSRELPSRLNNLGTGLTNRYSFSGSLADLQAGINAYEKAIALTPPDDFPELSSRLSNLGGGLWLRYVCCGEIADLQKSIKICEKAINLTPSNSSELPSRLNNLGNGLTERYMRLKEVVDLEKSIEVYERAVALTLPNSPNFSGYLTNLGKGLWFRYTHFREEKDLQRSIEIYEQAVALTPPNSRELPSRLNNLGIGLTDRYIRFRKMRDLQRSIEVEEKAVALTLSNSPDLPSRLNSLGVSLGNLHAHSGDFDDLRRGIDAFRKATQQGLAGQLENCFRAARNWLNWAFDRNSWQEMEDAYPTLKAVNDRLVGTQLRREHQESFLEETQGLTVKIAYARIQTGDLRNAAEALEQGIARLLSMALMLSRTDLTQLQQDTPELASAYKAHLIDWQNAQRTYHHVAPQYQAEAYQRLQTANQALDDVKQRICQLKGHENFLSVATDLQTIYQAAETQPLVYLFVTEKGSYALVVFQENIQAIALSELTNETFMKKISSYFEAYSKSQQNREIWYQAIEDIGQWLWQLIWQPLLNILPKHSAITLIPVGWLNLLPLYAAWTPDATRPTGKRYTLDDFTINYAPNALSLQKAKERATIAANKLLAIDEPKPVFANELPSSHVEVNAIAQYFTERQLFHHEQATVDAVKNALNLDYTVLHFSCHGGANLENPLETGLLMAMIKSPHNMLTVQDFFDAQLKARLVTLSACETGMIGIKQVEEVVSLPTSLLQAGVAGVVASLWSVSDVSTALLMIQFYQRWHNHYPDNPAEALRQAQQWVRDSTNGEKLAYLQTEVTQGYLSSEIIEVIKDAIGFASDSKRSFAHPYYWAAFTYTGV